MKNLATTVLKLISTKQEGYFWDFKRQWYSKDDGGNKSLIHDILCMANAIHNNDSLIIIGVDEENDYSVCDISSDSNRRNTQSITELIKSRDFAGDMKPVVYVETITINGKKIDVIVVKNTNLVPIYLTKEYCGIKPYHIYTRYPDSNTSINESADINTIEKLWRKRFGLDKNPLQRIEQYIEDSNNWTMRESENGILYYNDFPEFTIEFTYEHNKGFDGPEYYLFSQTDSKPDWNNVYLKYHQTILVEFEGMFLDGGRCLMIVPRHEFSNELHHYRYYIKDSIEHKLNLLFLNTPYGSIDAFDSMMNCVNVFEDIREKLEFDSYINKLDKIPHYDVHIPYIGEIEYINTGILQNEFRNALIFIKLQNEMNMNK